MRWFLINTLILIMNTVILFSNIYRGADVYFIILGIVAIIFNLLYFYMTIEKVMVQTKEEKK